MDGLKKWQKAVLVAGSAATAAGLAWYLLRDDGEEEEEEAHAAEARQPSGFRAPPGLSLDEAANFPAQATRGAGPVGGGRPALGPLGHGGAVYYKNIDPRGCSIGIRNVPDVTAAKTGNSIFPTEVFAVSEVHQVPGDQQAYLRLADGRGWAFTHSGNDGRLLAVQVNAEEAMKPDAMSTDMWATLQRKLAQDPQMREQVTRGVAGGAGLDPEFIRAMSENYPRVEEVLGRQTQLQQDLYRDPAALGASLRAAAAAAAEAGGPPLQPMR